MIAVIVLLLIAVATRWTAVREGIGRGFKWFDKLARKAAWLFEEQEAVK